MENQEMLTKEIGTIELESQTLEAKKVTIVSVTIDKIEKAKSNKLNCLVKHPDKEEPIKISSIAALEEKSVKNKGLWLNLDKDKNIQKGSAVAILLEKTNSQNINDLVGKEIETELDGKFLCFKMY